MKSDTMDTQLMKGSNGGTIGETIAKAYTMMAIIVMFLVSFVVAYSADVSNITRTLPLLVF